MLPFVVLPLVTLLFSLPLAGQEKAATLSAAGSQTDTVRKNDTFASIPCGEAKRIAAGIVQFTASPVFQRVQTALQDSLGAGRSREFAASFGRDSQGDTILSLILSGGRSSAPIPAVPNAFADVHTHPNNTPPSSGDVYGLLEKVARSPGYARRFVLTGNGTLYVLFVQDTAAVAAFLQAYPPQRLAGYSPLFPPALLDEFREIRYGRGAEEEWAMACILEKYKAGVLLFRQRAGGPLHWVRGCRAGTEPGRIAETEACQ